MGQPGGGGSGVRNPKYANFRRDEGHGMRQVTAALGTNERNHAAHKGILRRYEGGIRLEGDIFGQDDGSPASGVRGMSQKTCPIL